jgi:hypothetical protein
MAFLKQSSGIVVAATDIKTANTNIFYPDYYSKEINKSASKIEELSDEFVYSVVIGTQGDVFNENNDYWPWEDELLKANSKGDIVWKTWIGKPNCIDHKCASVMDHYGRIPDAWPNYPPKHIMMVIATSKSRNPELAKGIETGLIDKVSMSCEVGHSNCSYCGKTASNPHEYCEHINYKRGRLLPVKKGMKHYEGPNVVLDGFVRVGEICYDSTGRELSWVSNPAFTGCKSVSKLKLANKLDILADVYEARNVNNDIVIADTFRKLASRNDVTFDEKQAVKQILIQTGKGLYKDWIS